MRRILLIAGIITLLLCGICHGATEFAVCRVNGGMPEWVAKLTPEEWAQMAFALNSLNEDGTKGVYTITGPQEILDKVKKMSEVLPIGSKPDLDKPLKSDQTAALNAWIETKNVPVDSFTTKATIKAAVATVATELSGRIPFKGTINMPPDPDETPKVEPKPEPGIEPAPVDGGLISK